MANQWQLYTLEHHSLSSDGLLGHLLIHMHLETRAPGYWLVHIVVPPIGLQTPLAPWVLSLASPLGGPVFHPIADCEHPLLCLLGPDIVSQETAISGSFQQNIASVCNGVSVWKLIMGWISGYGNQNISLGASWSFSIPQLRILCLALFPIFNRVIWFSGVLLEFFV